MSTLNRVDTLRDTRNTTAATVQSDIFSPPLHGGPPELTGCNGVSEGKTIWYDFYPDANGTPAHPHLGGLRHGHGGDAIRPQVAAAGQQPGACVPSTSRRRPVNCSTTCRLASPTRSRSAGSGEAGGELEVLFDYLVQLKRLQAEATLTAQPLANGVRVVSLAVSAPKKARVEVRCTRGCSRQAKTGRFSGLRGAVLPNGAALKIYVTQKNEIGAYIEYRIGHDRFTKVQRCLAAGSKKVERLRMTASSRGRVAIAALIAVAGVRRERSRCARRPRENARAGAARTGRDHLDARARLRRRPAGSADGTGRSIRAPRAGFLPPRAPQQHEHDAHRSSAAPSTPAPRRPRRRLRPARGGPALRARSWSR